MTLEACYRALGGNYQDVLGRFRSEKTVAKFVRKFQDDQSCEELAAAVERQDGPAAFRAAHTVKGICQNLSFDRLYQSTCRLTEALRGGWSEDAPRLFSRVMEDYQITLAAIRQLDPVNENAG